MSSMKLFESSTTGDDTKAAGSGSQSSFNADGGIFKDNAAGRGDAKPGGSF
jgi:hypothetical protein